MKEEMLKKRNEKNAVKPAFSRQEFPKRKKLDSRWRRPKGLQSKSRLGIKGYAVKVSPGYGSQKEVKGFTKKGLKPVLVRNAGELKNVEAGCGAVISSSLGMKKRSEIIKKAEDLGIELINVKNPKEYLQKTSKKMQERAAKKSERKGMKEKKKAEIEKKASEKKKEELSEKLTEEEKKEKDRKEREKMLTRKEN